MKAAGLLLAAGAGRRMGSPKALLRDADGRLFVDRATRVLLDGGCRSVTVVLGAAAEEVAARWQPSGDVSLVVAEDWARGMGASLRAGLAAVADGPDVDAALVSLVDLPDVGSAVCRRVLASATGTDSLVRATYAGTPGHPVLIGRDHWAGVRGQAGGDRGARDYLRDHPPVACECGDLATGRDVDRPDDLTGDLTGDPTGDPSDGIRPPEDA